MTGSIFTLIFSIGFPVFSSIKVISPVSGSTFFTKSDITSPVSLFINISSPVFGSFFVIIYVVLNEGYSCFKWYHGDHNVYIKNYQVIGTSKKQ